MAKISVTIVEDEDEVRQRLAQLVNESDSFTLLASANTRATGLEDLLHHKPDVLLTDLGLPDGSGIDLIRAIHTQRSDTLAMVITGFHDEHTVFNALEAGAQGYILKHDSSQKIIDAIHQMINGGSPISPLIARLMLRRFEQPQIAPTLPEALTEHQVKILNHVSQGFSSKEIAEKLNVSYYTVTTHIKNIYGKLQVNSRTEAIFEAQKLGLLK